MAFTAIKLPLLSVVRSHSLVGMTVFARLAGALAVRLRYTDTELRTLSES